MGDEKTTEPSPEIPAFQLPQPETKIDVDKFIAAPRLFEVAQQNQYRQYRQQPQSDDPPPPYSENPPGGRVVYYVVQQPPNANPGQRAYRYNGNRPNSFENAEGDEIFISVFDSIKVRNQFVQKVYMILSVLLFFSFMFLLMVTFIDSLKLFIFRNYLPLLIICSIGYISIAIALFCCGNLRRQYPTNFILLGLLAVFMTGMISPVVALTPPITVLMAIGTTAFVCFVVSIFACQTKWDVTTCAMCFFVATIILCVYGLILMILMLCGIEFEFLYIIYSALAVLLFCAWLMYDTQMIMGGRRVELSTEEYILGALTLYIDIMIIFMHILNLLNACSR